MTSPEIVFPGVAGKNSSATSLLPHCQGVECVFESRSLPSHPDLLVEASEGGEDREDEV